MMTLLPTVPITDLPIKQPEILARLQKSPIILTHQGAAVLVEPDEWHTQQAELRRLRLLAEAMELKAKGEPTILLAEVKRRIAEKKANTGVGN